MKRLLLAAALSMPTAAGAGVTYDADTHTMTITGETTPYTLVRVNAVMSDNDVDTVFMSGPGGHFYASLDIGRAIRMEGARVIIPRGEKCVSACAFAALGATVVHADGDWLFHQPYIPMVPLNATLEDVARKHGAAYLDIAEYLVEMGRDIGLAKRIMLVGSVCRFVRMASDGAETTEDFCE